MKTPRFVLSETPLIQQVYRRVVDDAPLIPGLRFDLLVKSIGQLHGFNPRISGDMLDDLHSSRPWATSVLLGRIPKISHILCTLHQFVKEFAFDLQPQRLGFRRPDLAIDIVGPLPNHRQWDCAGRHEHSLSNSLCRAQPITPRIQEKLK